MSLFVELRRRNVFRVAIAYVVMAWLLVQVADVMIGNIGAPDWLFKFILLVLALGFPLAIIFSWVFEMTPEGLKREHEVDRTKSISSQTGRKLDYTIIAVLTIALAYFIYESRFAAPTTEQATSPGKGQIAGIDTAAINSIAVLPFVNMSGDAENEYFSDGLTETLLHVLAQLPDLQVAARTSSFAFKGKNESVTDIATALGVAHLLEGSVQKANSQVRVTAQLIRADDGFHVWSQNYTRPLEDIFAIQDEIASDVAKALGASLLGADTRLNSVNTSNLNAYETFLKALEQQAIFSYASLPRAEALLKEALAADPGFSDAKLALVHNYYFKLNTGMIDHVEAQKLSQPLLDQVYAVDPDNRTARLLELTIDSWFDAPLSPQDRREKLLEARDLLRYLPTETMLYGPVATSMSRDLGMKNEALTLIENGLMVDPMSPQLLSKRGELLTDMGRPHEGLAAMLRADELSPNDPNILAWISDIKAMLGDAAGSLEWMRRATVADPADHELAALLAINLYNLNLPDAARPWAERVAAQAAQSDLGRRVELVGAHTRGDPEKAELLARSMVADQVSVRFETYRNAVFTYQEILALQGRDADGLAFLRKVKPDFIHYDFAPQSYSDNLTYLAMARFDYMLQPPEQLKRIRQSLNGLAVGSGSFFDGNAFDRMFSAMLDEDQTISREILLNEVIPAPISLDPRLLNKLQLPMFAELTSTPEVQAAMSQRQRDTEVIREQVIEQLQQPEWNP